MTASAAEFDRPCSARAATRGLRFPPTSSANIFAQSRPIGFARGSPGRASYVGKNPRVPKYSTAGIHDSWRATFTPLKHVHAVEKGHHRSEFAQSADELVRVEPGERCAPPERQGWRFSAAAATWKSATPKNTRPIRIAIALLLDHRAQRLVLRISPVGYGQPPYVCCVEGGWDWSVPTAPTDYRSAVPPSTRFPQVQALSGALLRLSTPTPEKLKKPFPPVGHPRRPSELAAAKRGESLTATRPGGETRTTRRE